jgi:hypothetical protein
VEQLVQLYNLKTIHFSGQISTSELLDREEKSEYELLVEAVDRGQPPKSSQTVVKVMIEDVNDKTPG